LNKIAQAITVTEKQHGLFNDKKLYSFTLNNDGVEIEITNLGCIILSIKTRDKNGNIKNIVAGYTTIIGSQNKKYKLHSAVALETQALPDSPNHSNFLNTILHPGEIYKSTTIYAFGLINH
jgi:galactose mutarotase-like enzyme